MADNAELQAKIAALAGKLNRHKQQQQPIQPFAQTQPYQQSHHQSAPPYRGGFRGNDRWAPYRGGHAGQHVPFKNKTLVLAGDNPATNPPTEETTAKMGPALVTGSHTIAAQPPANENLVKTRGLNNQLMTKAAYEREQKAKQENKPEPHRVSKQQQQQQRNQEEKSKLAEHFQSAELSREMEVEGIRFHVRNDGSKLIRIPNPANTKETPRKAIIAGVEFLRTKSGNLVRRGVVKGAASTTKQPAQCEHFTKNGDCPFGPTCRFAHDPEKVAICKTYLRSGSCPAGEYCNLSHITTYHRAPACTHFFNGNCTNDACRYPHVRVSPGALVCRPFALLGYCDKGPECDKRHVFECPDFANEGDCPRFKSGKCSLPHIRHAFRERKAAEQQQLIISQNDVESELDDESEAEGEMSVGDVDSDDLVGDLVMTGSDDNGHELTQNRDFIAFS